MYSTKEDSRWVLKTITSGERQKRYQLIREIKKMEAKRKSEDLGKITEKVIRDLKYAGREKWEKRVEEILQVGSSANGFYGPGSDTDLVIVSTGADYGEVMEFVIEIIKKSFAFKLKKVLDKSKIPLVTAKHISTNRMIDITFDNKKQKMASKSWLNTQLLLVYGRNNRNLAPVFRLFKEEIKVPGASCQGLSTYSQLILFLDYLITTGQINQLTTGCFTAIDDRKIKPLPPSRMLVGFLLYILNLDRSQVIDITKSKEERQQGSIIHVADPYIFGKNVGQHCSAKNWTYIENQCLVTLKKYGYEVGTN